MMNSLKIASFSVLLLPLFLKASPPTLDYEVAQQIRSIKPGSMIKLEDIMPARSADQALNDLLKEHASVVLDFSASWCGPCKALAPHFEAAAKELTSLVLIKVDTDMFPSVSRNYGVNQIPTIICFKQGKVAERFPGGGFTKSTLVNKLKTVYNLN